MADYYQENFLLMSVLRKNKLSLPFNRTSADKNLRGNKQLKTRFYDRGQTRKVSSLSPFRDAHNAMLRAHEFML